MELDLKKKKDEIMKEWIEKKIQSEVPETATMTDGTNSLVDSHSNQPVSFVPKAVPSIFFVPSVTPVDDAPSMAIHNSSHQPSALVPARRSRSFGKHTRSNDSYSSDSSSSSMSMSLSGCSIDVESVDPSGGAGRSSPSSPEKRSKKRTKKTIEMASDMNASTHHQKDHHRVTSKSATKVKASRQKDTRHDAEEDLDAFFNDPNYQIKQREQRIREEKGCK